MDRDEMVYIGLDTPSFTVYFVEFFPGLLGDLTHQISSTLRGKQVGACFYPRPPFHAGQRRRMRATLIGKSPPPPSERLL